MKKMYFVLLASLLFNLKGFITCSNQKKENNMEQEITNSGNDLGSFSISLAVKDISASKDFYESIGFEILDGNVDQKWMILKNGNSKIGLFQDMFPQNTLTFNPTNGREHYKKVKNAEICMASEE